jgi:hypothetical protein
MVQTKTFVAVDFRGPTAHGLFGFRWEQPESIVVEVKPADSAVDSRAQRFDGPVVGADRLQVELAALKETQRVERPDYVLDCRADGRATRLQWTRRGETEALRQLRERLAAIAHLAFVEAGAHLVTGRRLIESGDARAAAGVLRKGIDILGTSYFDPGRLDDTGMKLVLAEVRGKEGEYTVAATLYERVLSTRIDIYAQHRLRDVEVTPP